MKIATSFELFTKFRIQPRRKCRFICVCKTICVVSLIFCAIIYYYKKPPSPENLDMKITSHLPPQPPSFKKRVNFTELKNRDNYTILENLWEALDEVASFSEETGNKVDSVTFATYAEYFDLHEILVDLVRQWSGFVSVAIYAPEHDFFYAFQEIEYLRECSHKEIKKRVSFHLFYETAFSPKSEMLEELLQRKVNCMDPPLDELTITDSLAFRRENYLSFPVALARNIARENSKTDYVLSGEINTVPVSKNLNAEITRKIRFLDSSNYVILIPVLNYTEIKPELNPDRNISLLRIESTQLSSLKTDFSFIGSKNAVPYDETVISNNNNDQLFLKSIVFSLCLLDFNFYLLQGTYLVKHRHFKMAPQTRNQQKATQILKRYRSRRKARNKHYKYDELKSKYLRLFGSSREKECTKIIKNTV